MLELLVAQVQKEFASQVEKSPEVAEAVARLDEAEDKVLGVIAHSLEKATEVVGETCMSGARRYLRELERRNSARVVITEKHKAEREREGGAGRITFGRHFAKTYQWVSQEEDPSCEWIRKDSTNTLKDLRKVVRG